MVCPFNSTVKFNYGKRGEADLILRSSLSLDKILKMEKNSPEVDVEVIKGPELGEPHIGAMRGERDLGMETFYKI